jgi:hypothetical protein
MAPGRGGIALAIQDSIKSGIVIKMCREAGLQPPGEELAYALSAESQRLAADIGLRESLHFLAIAVQLARSEPYDEVLRRMQALAIVEGV